MTFPIFVGVLPCGKPGARSVYARYKKNWHCSFSVSVLVSVDPSATSFYLFVGLVENPLISQNVKIQRSNPIAVKQWHRNSTDTFAVLLFEHQPSTGNAPMKKVRKGKSKGYQSDCKDLERSRGPCVT